MECIINGLSIYYEVYGEGRPFLMIHGFAPDHRLMSGCMEPVLRDMPGYQRIYIDLPGMGRTKGADWIRNSDDMLRIVEEFIESVIPGKSFLLAGESYGGYLARGLICRRRPVDGLLLICSMIIAKREERTLPAPVILKRDEALLSRLSLEDIQDFEESCVVLSERIYERNKNEVLSGVATADMAFLEALRENGYAFSFDPDRLSEPFVKPALFLHGRQDSVVGYEDAWPLLRRYPRATFAVLDCAGHNLQIEQEELFGALVRDWLSRCEAS